MSGVSRTLAHEQVPTNVWRAPWRSVPSLAGTVVLFFSLFLLTVTYLGLVITAVVYLLQLGRAPPETAKLQARTARLRRGLLLALLFPFGLVSLPYAIHKERQERRNSGQ